jgi:5-methylthioadenosine/S-adenosylhomocysteine deaminase
VLIAGKVMKREGRLVGVDMARIAKLGRKAQERNYKAANVPNKRI